MVIQIRLRHFLILLAVSILSLLFLCSPVSARHSQAQKDIDGPVSLPIFLYHIISPRTYQFGITPAEFESDLSYLSKNGYHTITMTQLINFVDSDKKLSPKPVILSFDDGYYNNYVYAFPLLKKYHAKIVLSIIGKSTDDFSEHPSYNLSYAHVTWDQLNEMLCSGLVEVQNHTYHLHETSKGRTGCMQKPGESKKHYEKVLTDDVEKLQKEITEMTGSTPNTFIYPYGKSSENTDEILKRLGFLATLSCDYGINLIDKSPDELFGLRRIERTRSNSIRKVLSK